MTALLPGAIVAGGLLAMAGEERGPRWLVYVFKPLTTALILALAASAAGAPARYQALLVVGLTASLAGDVFLMLPRDRFLPGLASFLGAHLAYGAAFVTVPDRPAAWVALGFLLLAGGAVLSALWAGLGGLRGPVVGYVAVILAMAWMAVTRWIGQPTPSAAAAAAGALLFVVSDSLLALDRFRGRFPLARAAVLTTYYAAQLLIASSAGFAAA